MQIFDMGYADWQLTPGGNCIILTRAQLITIARQLNPDSKEAIIRQLLSMSKVASVKQLY